MSPAPNGIGWHCEVSCVHWVTGNKWRWRECKESCGAAWWEERVGLGQGKSPLHHYNLYVLPIHTNTTSLKGRHVTPGAYCGDVWGERSVLTWCSQCRSANPPSCCRYSTTLCFSLLMAKSRHVSPSLSLSNLCWPNLGTRYFTTSRWPLPAARCRAFRPRC